MDLMNICLYLYLLLKPFYVFESGSIQPSDIFLILAFIFLLLTKNKVKISELIKKNYKFLIFTILVFVINLIYFIIYSDTKFMLSSIYFIFNFIGILVFSFVVNNFKIKSNIKRIFRFNLLLQLFIFIIGLGRYYSDVRYMGTFNDPNQFGYYILISYMFIDLISYDLNNKKGDFIFLLISIFLILQSASTGMLLGISCFLLLKIIDFIRLLFSRFKQYITKILLFCMFIVPVFIIVIILNSEYKFINIDKEDTLFIVSRVKEKFERVNTSTSDATLIEERGYDRFIYYPQYIFYGSGEGNYDRFTLTYHRNEIHATFPSILFYYGIIPFIILLLWFKDKIFPSNLTLIIPISALLLESFTLLNQRQLLFWAFFIFIDYIGKEKKKMVNL